ncbi:GlxA family transcriptional regulator [Salinisphaera orenii]|uniref:AraC family transcriptional regulator n=1 Tax=Salinisphaera orenii YIM 95161 TaxID=1051139 RepID=A0A423PHS7_9GAMM|nr:GlxA family transcriptional regulator [Salinisphaera halophila]ROO25115.1 AraC family transcriptional regulator [Salinisphaera halophila YIM 95161]
MRSTAGEATAQRPTHIGFLQVPNYSAIAFSTAIEPLRMANQLAGVALYDWSVITLDGGPVAASNGLAVTPDADIRSAGALDMLFVCGGTGIRDCCDRRLLAWLRSLAERHVELGAICTGTYLLAHANLLKGYRCTIHWENISSIDEEHRFPDTVFTSELFVIDRDRYTCAGGIAPLDLMLNVIGRQKSPSIAEAICEEFIHERIRNVSDIQRVPLRVHLGTSQPKLVEAVSLMEANMEEPLSLHDLARLVNVSRRQLERLFKKHLNCVPTRYYLELRLSRARQFLLQTQLSIIDVSLACGFSSPPHFSKCYHDFFGYPPSRERRSRAGGESSAAATATPARVRNQRRKASTP